MRAATRDASWFRSPRANGKPLVYHVVQDDLSSNQSACGIPVVAVEGFAPVRDVTVDADSVDREHRCGRPGCRAKWPKP